MRGAHRGWSRGAWLLAFGAANCVLALLGLAFLAAPSDVAFIWPASGLALAVFVRSGRSSWPALAAVTFTSGFVAQLVARDVVGTGLALAAINTLEPVLGALVLRRIAGEHGRGLREPHLRWVAGILAAAIVPTAVTALLGGGLAILAYDAPPVQAWTTWWLADGLGIVMVTPALLAIDGGRQKGRPQRLADLGLVLLAIAVTAFVFGRDYVDAPAPLQYPYFVMPALLWAGVRVGLRLGGLTITAVGLHATLATANGHGPFARPDLDTLDQALALQCFLAVLTLCTMLVGAVMAERRTAASREGRAADLLTSALSNLAESEERSRMLLSSLPDTVVLLCDQQLVCLEADGHGLAGMRWEDLVGRHLADILSREPARRIEPLCRRALAGERASVMYTSDGRHFDVDIAPFRRRERVEGTFIVLRDVSEREQARAQAEAASRAKSQFLANMSHEIRTPLNGVLGMAELLAQADLPDVEREHARTAVASGRVLRELIDNILDFSKIEAGKLTLDHHELDLRALVAETCAMVQHNAAARGLALRWSATDRVPALVRGDAGRLRQVLANLVANAVKFTERGEVAITVDATGDGGGRLMARVEVSDTGIGIEPGQIERLLEPFSQADASTTRRFGGTGLGLAISRELVELMGGELGARRRPGGGTTFHFTAALEDATLAAPAAGAQPAPVAPTAAAADVPPAPAPGGEAVHVLVVEDHPINQRVVCGMLEKRGMVVDVVGNGFEALERFEASRHRAVFMDCQMPGIDGYETTRRLRASEAVGQRVLIIALTANALEGDRERCLDAGMDDYLSKPVRPEELDAALARWLGLAPPESGRDGDRLVDLDRIRLLLTEAPDVVGDLVDLFAGGMPPLLVQLRTAVEAGDEETITGLAHLLRGNCDNVGATLMSQITRRLADPRHRGAAVDALDAALPQTCAALRHHLPRAHGGAGTAADAA